MAPKSIAKRSEFFGKLTLRELERKAFDANANQNELWVQDVLKASAPKQELVGLTAEEWAAKGLLDVSVHVEKIGSEYQVKGSFKGEVLAPCSRCGDPFKIARNSDFNVFLVNPKHEKDFSDDPDFLMLESDEIDLISIISEQIIVLEGVAECPARKDDGSCTLCGLNPHFDSVSEAPRVDPIQESEIKKENLANSPFAKLKGLKLS